MTTNTIIADGNPRFNRNSLSDYLVFDNYSAVIGENVGENLTSRSYLNTLLGYKSAESSTYLYFNTFIGAESGANIDSGTSNIIIGKEYMQVLSNNKYSPISTSNIISLGINNKTSDNSISIGHSNSNIDNYGLSIGRQNIIKGKMTNCIGNNNKLINSHESIIIGNTNGILNENYYGDNIFIFGNSNICSKKLNYEQLLSKQPIIIGNNLNNDNINCTINIGDTFVKYDDYVNNEYILIGSKGYYNDLPNVLIGLNYRDITSNVINTSNNASLYVKNGVMVDKIIFGDFSSNVTPKYEVSIGISSNITSNIHYYLPDLPDNPNNMFLTTSNNGELYWKYVTSMGGSIDMSLYNTDNLREGNNNFYFTNQRFDNRFDSVFVNKISNTSLDEIQNGSINTYIKNGIYNRDLVIFGTLTVNKIRVLGVNFNPDTTLEGYIEDVVYSKTIELIHTLEVENSNLKVQVEKNKQDILNIQQIIGI